MRIKRKDENLIKFPCVEMIQTKANGICGRVNRKVCLKSQCSLNQFDFENNFLCVFVWFT